MDELNVAFRVVQDDNHPVGELFFSDTLENGSGFCQFIFDDRKNFKKNFLDVFTDTQRDSAFIKLFKNHNCFFSCYDCIKDYSNQFYHNYLNWRLGLDMIYLALNSKNFPGFTTPHWKRFIETHIGQLDPSKPIIVEEKEVKKIIVHPLWSRDYIKKIQSDNQIDDYTPVNIFTFVSDGQGLSKVETKNLDCNLPNPGEVNGSSGQREIRPLKDGEELNPGVLYKLKDGSTKPYPLIGPDFNREDVEGVII